MDSDLKLPDSVVVVSQNKLWVGLLRTDLRVSVVVRSDKDEIERVANLLAEFDYDPTKQTYPVYNIDNKVVGCLS